MLLNLGPVKASRRTLVEQLCLITREVRTRQTMYMSVQYTAGRPSIFCVCLFLREIGSADVGLSGDLYVAVHE
jgi:hypothetical protein